MTLSQLDDTLPNGLHDALLVGLSISFEHGTATLAVKVQMSDMAQSPRYEDAEIRLSNVLAFVIDGPEKLTALARPLGISSFETSEQHYPAFSGFPQNIRELFLSLYVEEPWNSYIHIAAESAEIEWRGQRH